MAPSRRQIFLMKMLQNSRRRRSTLQKLLLLLHPRSQGLFSSLGGQGKEKALGTRMLLLKNRLLFVTALIVFFPPQHNCSCFSILSTITAKPGVVSGCLEHVFRSSVQKDIPSFKRNFHLHPQQNRARFIE